VVFHPTKEAHNFMKSDLKISESFFYDELTGKQIEGNMFEVYA